MSESESVRILSVSAILRMHFFPCILVSQVRISEDIDFNHGMKKTCAYEINQLCKDMPHGHGRIIRCVSCAPPEVT